MSKAETALKLQHEATERGLELIGPGSTSITRSYSFVDCGHHQELDTRAVRRGQIKCKVCHHDKLQREAAAQNLKLTGAGHNAQYREYMLECGHTQQIRPCEVRIGIVNCRTCGIHSWTKPSQLYVIRVALDDGQSYVKLGYSNNIERRIEQYGLPYYATTTILATATFQSREEADTAESMLFDRYREWHIPSTEVDDIFTRSGSTEVYHHSIEESARLFVRDLDFLLRKAAET